MIFQQLTRQSFARKLWDETPRALLVLVTSVATIFVTQVVPKSARQRLGELLIVQPHRFLEAELAFIPRWLLIGVLGVAILIAFRARNVFKERIHLLIQERDSLKGQVEGHMENYRKREQQFQQQLGEIQNPPSKLVPAFGVCWEIDLQRKRVVLPPLCLKAECLDKKQRLAFSHNSGDRAVYRCPGCGTFPIGLSNSDGRGLAETEATTLLMEDGR